MNPRQSIPLLPTPTIERPRLLKALGSALQHKLIIVTAPPGYGKTTLIAQYVRQIEAPLVWQTIEELDQDLPNLYSHSLAIFAEIMPEIQELTFHPRNTASELVTRLTDYLRDHLLEDTLYILDDVHFLVGTPVGDAWLRTLVTALPSKCHLVLSSRILPKLPLTEMIARREILAIGQTQLRFTSEEIQQLAQQTDVELMPLVPYPLTTRLDGWPAGVILALQPLPSEWEQTLFTGEGGPEALFNDLARQMLALQSADLRRFLLLSSVLTRVTPDLCEHVLELSDSATYLSEALRRNLFVHQVPGGVVYHSLFRDFLQHQLQLRHPTEFVQLHMRAGKWFEANNRLDEAFTHYRAGELWARASAVAQRAAQAYFAQGKIETLLKWSTQLHEINILAPRLHYTCAMTYVDRYQYDLALAELTKASEGFQATADAIGLFQVDILLGTIDTQRGQYQGAVQRAKHLLENPKLPLNLRSHVLVTLGYATLQLGDALTALQYFETALPMHRDMKDAYAISQVLQYLELAYIRLGRFDEAGQCLQEIVAIRRSFGSIIGLAFALNDLGYYYQQTGDYERAFQTFQEGLSILSRSPQRRAESVLLWSIGDLQRDRGAFNEASQYYLRSMGLMTDSEPSLRCGVLNSLSVLRRWEGKLNDANDLAEEAFQLAHQYHLALEQTKAEMSRWAVRAQGESPALSMKNLHDLAKALRQQQSYARLGQTWGLCAAAALLQKDKAEADHYFKWIDQTISHPANLQPLVAEVFHTPALKEFVRERSSRYPRIFEGLQRLEQAQVQLAQAEAIEIETATSIFSLHIWTLGQEKVERDGLLIPSSNWRMMSRVLFFYLLLKGPTSREQISLEFWPEGTPQQVRRNFHTTLHRVRQALGENVIVFQDDRYLINPDLDLWCDVNELEAVVQEARLLAPRTAHAERLWQTAVELYQGEFLPSIDREWIIAQREWLREVYLEALIGLGNCVRARGDLSEAIAIYKRAAEFDPYREDVHRMILTAYDEQGKRNQILKHYHELIAFLQEELAVEPSDETRALAEALLA